MHERPALYQFWYLPKLLVQVYNKELVILFLSIIYLVSVRSSLCIWRLSLESLWIRLSMLQRSIILKLLTTCRRLITACKISIFMSRYGLISLTGEIPMLPSSQFWCGRRFIFCRRNVIVQNIMTMISFSILMVLKNGDKAETFLEHMA